jgi:multiple sugar transport system ATP-binding protein
MRAEIAALRTQFGTTMIYVTHDHLEAMLVGDRVAVLHEGTLQQVAEPLSLYQRPANLFVARFIGSPPMNLFRGMLSRKGSDLVFTASQVTLPASVSPMRRSLSVRLGSDHVLGLEAWVDKAVVLGVRAENIRCLPESAHLAAPSSFAAKVSSVENTGQDTYLRAFCGEHSFVVRVSPGTPVAPGQECAFDLDTRGACFFDPVTGKAII